MRISSIVLLISSVCCFRLAAQPSNDKCANAYYISQPSLWCSNVATFTTIKATADSGPTTSCFTSAGGDVWFRFIASAPDVLIKIISPAIDFAAALYQGDCSQFFEVACNKNAINHSVALYHSQLLVGKSYLIRVKAQNLLGGDFQICINNYYPQPVQGADCITAFRLCDKNPFTSAGIFGYGNIKEMQEGVCFSSQPGVSPESNSIWYKWICKDSGTLTLDLIPLVPNDDIDFIIYKLDMGINSCQKSIIRCMATGVITSNCGNGNECCGPTGLRDGETDISEPAGCSSGQNNYLKPIEMKAGESYILVINNYTSQNNQVTVSFGGSGTFAGLKPEFTFETRGDTLCRLDTLHLIDKTKDYPFKISNSHFNFYSDSVKVLTADSTYIQYQTSGKKKIELIVQDEVGCISRVTDSVYVKCCGGDLYANITELPNVTPGESLLPILDEVIGLEGNQRSYQWMPPQLFDCDTCSTPVLIAPDSSQWIYVMISDERGCVVRDSIALSIETPLKDYKIFLPNAFTPNHDGVNDYFKIAAGSEFVKIVSFAVFNRWGACVYEEKNHLLGDHIGWDGKFKGKECSSGTYVWVTIIELASKKRILYKGSVTLL